MHQVGTKSALSRQKHPQIGKKSAKIETQKELTAENQAVSSFQGAPGGIWKLLLDTQFYCGLPTINNNISIDYQ